MSADNMKSLLKLFESVEQGKKQQLNEGIDQNDDATAWAQRNSKTSCPKCGHGNSYLTSHGNAEQVKCSKCGAVHAERDKSMKEGIDQNDEGWPHGKPAEPDLLVIVGNALDAAIRSIQKELGNKSGDVAAHFFDSEAGETIWAILKDYAEKEIAMSDEELNEITGDDKFDTMMGKITKGARYKGAAADQRADAAFGGMMNNVTKNAADVAKPSADSKFEKIYSAVERTLLNSHVHSEIDSDIMDVLEKLKIKATDALIQKLERELINRVSDALQYYDDSDLAEQSVLEGSGDKNQLKQEIKELEKLARHYSFEPSQTDPKTGNGYRPNYIKTVRKIEKLKAQLKSQQGVSEASRGFRGVGGAREREDDERHDLTRTDWYIVKDGKLLKALIYPSQEAQARAEGFSPTREEARAKS